ncbi:DUF4111 domain-containing protein [Paracoccus caeni]|uniref:Aminoglycoside (3'') (9) adenylyltransferase n=1 Tax=Paracoccus caeni TaxID=657651 RepID=A0A934VXQ0_9RHOB|nr:aminoglycoside adenylyltransferase family protein [Paracoccus caeni]MBK4215192.1 DUF4111 domain-containing protein [Paracoccus caeni]
MQMTQPQSDQIGQALTELGAILGDSVQAVYLHGSAVSGGLRPHSDIDLLVVTESTLKQQQRAELLAALLRLSATYPAMPDGPRCLEVMVFTRSDLSPPAFPTRADFVYGEWLRDEFLAGAIPMPADDPEHTLLLAQARREARALVGLNAETLLPRIPVNHIRRAMRDLVPALLNGLEGDERNVLLTLARMWHTADTGAFVSKDAAADWAMPRLDAGDARTLDRARRGYLGESLASRDDHNGSPQQLAGLLARKVTALTED